MKITIQFPEKEFQRMLEQFQSLTRKSWPKVLRQQGRLIAVNLAIETQPYGSNRKKTGEIAVARDIGLVFDTYAEVYQQLKAQGDQIAGAFYHTIMANKWRHAERILRACGISTPIGSVKSEIHQSKRDKHGRVRKDTPAAMIVRRAKSIDTYSKRVARRVGFAKSGFATAAKSLGGTRGIPHWAKRGKAPGRVEDHSHASRNPHIFIVNDVSYIKQVCSDASVQKALRIQKEKMMKHIQHVMRHSGKKAGMRV